MKNRIFSFTTLLCCLFVQTTIYGGGDYLSELKHYVTDKELNTFVPTVVGEDIFVINRCSPEMGLFNVKGCIFPTNPSFPIELGDQVLVTDEYKEYLSNHSYRVHCTLTSLTTHRTERFVSNVIDQNNFYVIKTVQENRRDVYTEETDEYFGGSGYIDDVLIIEYLLTLDDGTQYTLVIDKSIPSSHGSKESLLDIAENFHIFEGDVISHLALTPTILESRIRMTADLHHNVDGELVPYSNLDCRIYGEPRIFDDYANTLTYLVRYRHFYFLEKEHNLVTVSNFGPIFESIYREQRVIYDAFYSAMSSEQAANGVYTSIDQEMDLIGFFLDENNRRVMVFSDSNNHFIFLYTSRIKGFLRGVQGHFAEVLGLRN